MGYHGLYVEDEITPGDVKPSFVTVEPDGWYFANGQSVSASENPLLAALFGANAGLVQLPDLRGIAMYGADAGHTPGTITGEDSVNLTHAHQVSGTTTSSGSMTVGLLGLLSKAAPENHTHHFDVTSGSALDTIDKRPRRGYLNYLIKAG